MDGSASAVRDNNVTGVRGQPWRLAYREALSPYIFRRVLIVIGLYLGAYTAMCPLGTNDLPWAQRLAFFGLSAALCAPLCHAEYVVTLYLTRFSTSHYIALAVAATTLITTPTCVAIAYGVDTLLRTGLSTYDLSAVYLFMALTVFLCSAVIHYMVAQRVKNEFSGGPDTETLADPASPEVPDSDNAALVAAGTESEEPPSKFLDRLPLEVGRDIIYLKMSDHYVDVVTSTGRCTILMRFAEAVAELGDQGVRVHRSYWVAYSHVEGWARRNQRSLLRLAGGHTVPVSRTYLSHTRSALASHPAERGHA